MSSFFIDHNVLNVFQQPAFQTNTTQHNTSSLCFDDLSAAHVVISFVSDEILTCRLLKWLLDHPMSHRFKTFELFLPPIASGGENPPRIVRNLRVWGTRAYKNRWPWFPPYEYHGHGRAKSRETAKRDAVRSRWSLGDLLASYLCAHNCAANHAGVWNKRLFWREPLPCNPAAETALQPPIWCPAGWYSYMTASNKHMLEWRSNMRWYIYIYIYNTIMI